MSGSTFSFLIVFSFLMNYIVKSLWPIIAYWVITSLISNYILIKHLSMKYRPKFDLSLITIILVVNIIYVHFYDAIHNLLPSHSDSLNTYKWLEHHILNGLKGHLPGSSILGYVPYLISDPLDNINFFSAALSLILLIGINLTLNKWLSFYGLILFNLTIISIVYYPLLYLRIGLQSTSISILYFYIIISILICYKQFLKNSWWNLIFVFTTLMAATIVAPHILTLMIPSIILSFLVLRNIIDKNFKRYIIMIFFSTLILSILYLYVNFGSQTETFGAIQLKSNSNYIFEVIYDYLKIKKIGFSEEPNYLTIGSYIFLIVNLVGFIYSFRYHQTKYQILFAFNIPLNVSSVFGIFEFTYLQGRSGFLLLCGFALIIATLGEDLLQKKSDNQKKIIIAVAIFINFLVSIYNPPNNHFSL
jgi:hypothetical protein